MEIKVLTRSSETKQFITACINWLGIYLINKRLLKNMYIEVSFEDTGNAYAYTTWEDNNIRPKEFSITIHHNIKLNVDMMVTLAHEMVHVMQFVNGDLQDTKFPNYKRWLGQIIEIENEMQLPWETEASDLELIILRDMLDAVRDREIVLGFH